eukprot:CAMPEP_0117449982 /NCGR_PEP_ID=MMETSP0759-20121206/8229_1 /TAXON_ID=63605 /ORGANISM="Percolomonas cosmopolitus, Strain WS" /LENGTH=388 /DNA_ID=CAMNT_0005242481 /DNA_START=291 /DNA_END=1457 /DNA_ORIENTATION=-
MPSETRSETIYREPYRDSVKVTETHYEDDSHHHKHRLHDRQPTELNYAPTTFDDRGHSHNTERYDNRFYHPGEYASGMHQQAPAGRALPPDAEVHKYETYTYRLKSTGSEFDTTMPYALRDRMTKNNFLRHVEKVNDMMRQRPAELSGYALESQRKKKKWATGAILADILLAVLFIIFVAAFATFWVFLGIAADDVVDWWWPTVIAGAIWVMACFFITAVTPFAILCHHKWRKWQKIEYDEENMQKFHGIITFLRRENEREFSDKGLSWELALNRPDQHEAGWTRHHQPALEVLVYHKTPIPRVQASEVVGVQQPMHQTVRYAPQQQEHVRIIRRQEQSTAPPDAPPAPRFEYLGKSSGTTSTQKDVVVMKPTMERTAVTRGQKDSSE